MKLNPRRVLETVLTYTLWILVSAAGFYLLLRVRESYLLVLAVTLGDESNRVLNVIDKVTMVILGVGMLGYIVGMEWYLDRAPRVGVLLQRFARILGSLLIVYAAADLAGMLAVGMEFQSARHITVFAVIVACGAALLLTPLWARLIGRVHSSNRPPGSPGTPATKSQNA